MSDQRKPTREELDAAIVTDECGDRWDKSEWLEFGRGEGNWDTCASLTIEVAALRAERSLWKVASGNTELRIMEA